MKLRLPLIEATLLKRNLRFLMDVVLKNKRRRTIYCPNLGPLRNCDVLGTRLWFSPANRLSQGYLDVVELMEVNDGWMVAVNPGYAQILVREGIKQGTVTELLDYRFLHLNNLTNSNKVDLLLKENGDQCFLHVEPVFFGDGRGDGYFPETSSQAISQLQELTLQRTLGHRAILFFCVQHAGLCCVRSADKLHPLYGQVLRNAVAAGVEVLAYRANVNLQEITLDSKLPVLLSENRVSG